MFFIGMRRSGIHGIVSWLLPQFPGMTRFVNDPPFTAGKGDGPFAGQPIRYYFSSGGRCNEVIAQHELASVIDQGFKDGAEKFAETLHPLWRWAAKSVLRKYRRFSAGKLGRDPAFVYGGDLGMPIVRTNLFVLENITPAEFAGIHPEWRAKDYTDYLAPLGLTPPKRTRIVLLLRDPWNQLASILKRMPLDPPRPVRPEEFRATWLAYAEEFAGYKKQLSSIGDVVTVSFPRWFKDEAYRAELVQKLGLTANDLGLGVVSNFGGGSSFEGREKTGKAQDMKVDERWRAYAEHPLMKELREDKRVDELCREIFGAGAPTAS